MSKNKQRTSDLKLHLFLLFVLLVGAVVFLFLPPLPGKKEGMIIGLSTCYFLWGLWYHQKKDNLSLRIGLEYLALAVLGAVLLFGLI